MSLIILVPRVSFFLGVENKAPGTDSLIKENRNLMYRVLCDSGFWFGLFDPSDDYYFSANSVFDYLEKLGNTVYLMPYPSLYETLRTEICGNKSAMECFNRIVDNNCERIPDDEYREDAFRVVRSKTNYLGAHYSFVDVIIRYILDDPKIKKDYLVTTNVKDFKDIADKNQVEIEEILLNSALRRTKK